MECLPWTAKATVYCPVAQRSVTVRYLTLDGAHAIDIVSCSGFGQVDAIGCGTACLGDEGRILASAEPVY